MKKLCMLFLAAISPIYLLAAVFVQAPNQNSSEIDLEKVAKIENNGNLGFPRSINFLQAYYDTTTEVVSITHEGLGETDVYILNKSGDIIYQDKIYSTNYSTNSFPIPFPKGEYTIVIDSEHVYAYGVLVTVL